MPGHTVLQLPVPPLEAWVRERTLYYDAGFVSDDDTFGHAHITALAPFTPAPTPDQLATITDIADSTAPITTLLRTVDQFPNGIIHLRPEPDDALRDLSDALVAAFPDFPPYEGRFGPRVAPHLTLDAASSEVTIASTRRLLGEAVPVTCALAELQLAWWESDRCHVMHRWDLGAGLRPPARRGRTGQRSAPR